jgi:hypothetical protein
MRTTLSIYYYDLLVFFAGATYKGLDEIALSGVHIWKVSFSYSKPWLEGVPVYPAHKLYQSIRSPLFHEILCHSIILMIVLGFSINLLFLSTFVTLEPLPLEEF